MALLQISEPGRSPDPHQRRTAVGIDLGTTHSLVAAVRNGTAECLPDAQGRVLLPSVVRFQHGGKRQVGHDALAAIIDDASNTIASFKRFMGRGIGDLHGRAELPYRFVESAAASADGDQLLTDQAGGMVGIRTADGVKSPVQISAEILAVLRRRAEDTLDDDLFGAVITVPAYFDDAQRQATKDAAQLAGIHLLRLINEPTAAAIAYGLDNASEGVYAVFDLGGGTFDISILRLTQGVFEVLATGGDSALGGDDYDAAIAAWFVAESGIDPMSPGDIATLNRAARKAKEQLSTIDSVALCPGGIWGNTAFPLTFDEFNSICALLTERTLVAVRKTLRDARLSVADVQGVVMVGGSTRMPSVQRAVGDLFQTAPLNNLNPDEVVALGASIQANQLAGNGGENDLLLLDVIPLSLGIETMGGLVERIVPRNETIPTAKAQDFTTYQDGQTALALHVVQGERDLVTDCRSLARFELRGIPAMAAGAARIRVTFTVDADGLLSVDARELGSGVEARVEVKPSYGLSDDQIARMLQESFNTADEDIAARALVEARVDADRLMVATRSALKTDERLIGTVERASIDDAISLLEAQVGSARDATEIEAATSALAKATESFAAARMNDGIRQALSGKNVNSI